MCYFLSLLCAFFIKYGCLSCANEDNITKLLYAMFLVCNVVSPNYLYGNYFIIPSCRNDGLKYKNSASKAVIYPDASICVEIEQYALIFVSVIMCPYLQKRDFLSTNLFDWTQFLCLGTLLYYINKLKLKCREIVEEGLQGANRSDACSPRDSRTCKSTRIHESKG